MAITRSFSPHVERVKAAIQNADNDAAEKEKAAIASLFRNTTEEPADAPAPATEISMALHERNRRYGHRIGHRIGHRSDSSCRKRNDHSFNGHGRGH